MRQFKRYSVYTTGELLEGFQLKDAVQNLFSKGHFSKEDIKDIFQNKGKTLKSNLTFEQAKEEISRLRGLGIQCYARESGTVGLGALLISISDFFQNLKRSLSRSGQGSNALKSFGDKTKPIQKSLFGFLTKLFPKMRRNKLAYANIKTRKIKKRYIILLVLIAVFYGLFSLSDAPIDVSLQSQDHHITGSLWNTSRQIIIRSKVDNIVIEDLILNRGNCDYDSKAIHHDGNLKFSLLDIKGHSLKFGEVQSRNYFCERLLEARVETNLGTYTFTFN